MYSIGREFVGQQKSPFWDELPVIITIIQLFVE